MNLGMKRIKIPSGEITNLPYLRRIGGFAKQVILSTGMSNLADIEAALEVLEQAGIPHHSCKRCGRRTCYFANCGSWLSARWPSR
jgi:sialic acid synthase SpsE